jgi:hypothetical protein
MYVHAMQSKSSHTDPRCGDTVDAEVPRFRRTWREPAPPDHGHGPTADRSASCSGCDSALQFLAYHNVVLKEVESGKRGAWSLGEAWEGSLALARAEMGKLVIKEICGQLASFVCPDGRVVQGGWLK